MFRLLLALFVIALWDISSGSRGHGPCSHEYLFFEFITQVPENIVKYYFSGVKVIYAFKVIGARQYLFVVENDQSKALQRLKLPEDASVTVSTFPIETLDTFLYRFGINIAPEELETLNDKDLTFVERIWDTSGMNEDEYAASLAGHINKVRPNVALPPRSRFVAVAGHQTKFLLFWERSDCDTASIIFNNTDTLGGPGSIRVRVLKIINVS